MKTISILFMFTLHFLAVNAETFASCNGLNFTWNPITANYMEGNSLEGTLSITRKPNSTV